MRKLLTITILLLAVKASAMFQGLENTVPRPGHAAVRMSSTQDRMGRNEGLAISGGISQTFGHSLGGLLTTNAVAGATVVPDHSVRYEYAPASRRVTDVDCLVDGMLARHIDICYDSEQRVATLQDGDIFAAYYGATNLQAVGSVVIDCGGATNVIEKAMAWDASNGRVTNIVYTLGTNELVYGYTYPTNSQRIARMDLPDGTFRDYEYDHAGQLTSAVHRAASSGNPPVIGASYAYSYDDIGNPLAGGPLVDGVPAHSFTADLDNFHAQRDWGGAVAVAGSAATNATISVNLVRAERQGERFHCRVPVDNALRATNAQFTVTAARFDPTNGVDRVRDVDGGIFVPKATESVAHSQNGYITADSRWQYTWNFHRQLVELESIDRAPALKLAFDYYPSGQRARKRVYLDDGGGWTLERTHQYIYERWNLVQELIHTQTHTLTNSYIWGLDLAGMQSGRHDQQSGGIGGLLAIELASASTNVVYLPIADANGNIRHLVDAATEEIVASYDYSPFGRLTATTGSAADACPFRFSSKYYDAEVGLYYYGHRYYDPAAMKWLSRDPLGERGGINLTAFCGNDPVNGVDALGLAAYFFGGTGNSRDKGHMTNVEILYEAWLENSGHGKAYYVPGVFSGKKPSGDDYLLWKLRVGESLAQGARGATLGKRVDEMMGYLDKAIASGDKEVNVFGFSRGSLTAIEFLNQIHENPKYKDVNVNFVVLWDTVKYASKKYRHNLPEGMKFNYAPLHLIALDEQRSQFFNEDVLDVAGALQIGYRGVHADAGGFLYKDKMNVFGRETLNDVTYMANLIGIKFDRPTIDSLVDSGYKVGQYDAIPTYNDTVFYKDGTIRTFPKGMYLDNSVKRFTSPVRNPIGNHPEISRGDLYRWAKRYYPANWKESDW